MRYVIAVCLLTGIIVWDAVHYDGRYLDATLRAVSSMVRSVVN
ncbi:hypothetical protein RB623_27965 [Mesorhizobium sp. LHD-90]|nr:hypothetical protein [Mesorhizobium sp. LHD-90]MDQ6437909.1 hypothetical protein [Mesorhizobium sp. LHD-90]